MSTRSFASRSLVTGVLMSVMLMGTGGPLSAQETVQNGAVFGTITDQTGASLPGVTVDVSSPSLQGKQSAVTDGQGAYRVGSLPAGVYHIEYSLSGFRTDVRSGFTLAVGFNARVDVIMKLGSVEERVEVTGSRRLSMSRPPWSATRSLAPPSTVCPRVAVSFRRSTWPRVSDPRTRRTWAAVSSATSRRWAPMGTAGTWCRWSMESMCCRRTPRTGGRRLGTSW